MVEWCWSRNVVTSWTYKALVLVTFAFIVLYFFSFLSRNFCICTWEAPGIQTNQMWCINKVKVFLSINDILLWNDSLKISAWKECMNQSKFASIRWFAILYNLGWTGTLKFIILIIRIFALLNIISGMFRFGSGSEILYSRLINKASFLSWFDNAA